MVDLVTLINFCLDSAALILMLLGLLLSWASRKLDRWTGSFLTVFFSVLLLYVGFNLLSLFMEQFPDKAGGTKAALFLAALFAGCLLPMLTVYLVHNSGRTLCGVLPCMS